MKKIIIYILTLMTAVIMPAEPMNAQTGHSDMQGKAEALAADPALEHAIVGICVRTSGGEALVDINSDRMMVPASNMKLISTGAALHALGPDYQYETEIGYSGAIEGGVLHGDLYIVGAGDPTTASKDSIATPVEALFKEWEEIVKAAGIRRIEGRIVGDGRHFEGMPEEPSWLWNDIGTYYGAGVTGLMFYENMQSFSVSAGPETGAPVNIRPYYPDAPWMEFRYACSTGKEGTGDQLYMYTSDLAPIAEIRGTFGVDRAAKRVDCSNKFPEYTCAYHFAQWLDKRGVGCTEGAADFRLRKDWLDEIAFFDDQPHAGPVSADDLTIIGSTFSPTLGRIAFETNHASNNLFAETLLRTLGRELHGSACYDSSYVALNDVLKTLGISQSHGAKIQDGSGLSRQNYVSPEFICRFLGAMMDSPVYETYLASLPSPGGNGTLQYNMKGQPVQLRDRIKVKSGSMNGVRCYSGYILPSAPGGETLIFSIMTNNCTSPTWKVRPLLDKMMVTLAQSN